ncbi:quercetin dioxygenase-like cupin family protein [Nakamurella sp. UYEF19]|uniref:cupin domain-containing protein n=1 Tax=Nakamurella sp. UYEF19 TaxID=1756392 RepID=UPI00339A5807
MDGAHVVESPAHRAVLDSVDFVVHGSTFRSFASTARGSSTLSAWQLAVPPGLTGTAHRPGHEEVILLLDGSVRITLDDVTSDLEPGAVVVIPAGSELRVDGGPAGATAWVTTTSGLRATTADGTVLSPPWAQ